MDGSSLCHCGKAGHQGSGIADQAEAPAGAQALPAEHRREAPPPRSGGNLESLVYNVTPGKNPWDENGRASVAQVVALRCNARTCPRCGPVLGYRTRQALEAKASLFKRPQLVSFTVSHEHFATAQAAHDHVTHGRYIALAMRALGIKRWVWVLEFHKGRAENQYVHRGWPHWHVVMDVSDKPIRPKDLQRLHRLWRDKWRMGGFKLSRKRRVSEPLWALRYITKYLMKPGHIPGWFSAGTRRRMIQASRGVGALCFRGKPESVASRLTPKPRRHTRSLAQRVAECRTKVTLLNREFEEHITEGGEVVPQLRRTEWKGTVNVPWDELVNAILSRQVDGFGLVVHHRDEDGELQEGIPAGGGRLVSIRIVAMDGQAGFVRLRAWAEQQGWTERVDRLTRARLAELLVA